MGIADLIATGLILLFLALALLRLFAAPLRLALKLILNTALGLLVLFILGLSTPLTGFSLGLNIPNALTVGVLGLPGLGLLLLLQTVFI